MKHYEEQIIYAIEKNLQPTDEIAQEWERLEKGEINSQKSLLTVNHLTQTEWGQGCYYNEECPECDYPEECQCGHTLVGCVAVAMGQVMKYHEYPDYGYGDTSYVWYGNHDVDFGETRYLWQQMPDEFIGLHNHNGPTALYHCGVSVGMRYGEYSSGALTSDVVYALKYHFNYAANAEYKVKDDYIETTWINMLKDELNAGRPMVYKGGGHAWVCDGYDNYNRFWMNWGWEGMDNQWYTLDDLTPDEHGGNYGYDQAAIFEIQPPGYAVLPYSTGFENGLDKHWIVRDDSDYGRIRLTTSYSPHSGSCHLIMDVSSNGNFNTNEALLHLNLGGETNVDLEFWWKEFGDEYQPADGIYFSDNSGGNFSKVYNLSGNNGNWQKVILDVDQLANTHNLSLTNEFVIKFQQYDNYPIPSDGFAFDDISVSVSSGYDPPPQPGYIYGPYEHCTYDIEEYYIMTVPGATSYEWFVTPPARVFGSGTNVDVFSHMSGYYTLKVRAINYCGSSDWREREIYIEDCGYFMLVPNPANEYFDVIIDEEKLLAIDNSSELEEFEIKVLTQKGTLKIIRLTKECVYRFNTKNLPPGIYIVQLKYKSKIFLKQLIIQH